MSKKLMGFASRKVAAFLAGMIIGLFVGGVCGCSSLQPATKYFLDALYEFAAERIAAEQVRINLGTVAIYPMIDGSFDSEDAPFDPKRNSLYVGATLSQELRDRVAGIAPDFAGDVSLGTVKLHSCMDLETEVFKVIRGTEDFCLAGANVTVPDGEDESLGLYAKDGVDKVADIVVSETDGGQQLFCHLSDAAAVPKGTYKVRLASHGLDPTDPLTVATLTLTLVEAVVPPAELTRSYNEGGEDNILHNGEDIFLEGVNLAYRAGDVIRVERDDEGPWNVSGDAIEKVDDTKLKIVWNKTDIELTYSGDIRFTYKGSTLDAQIGMS